MSASAFNIVAKTLKERIEAAVKGLIVPPHREIVHVGPLDDKDAKDAKLVLFLYRVSVNTDLRNAGHRVVSPNPTDPIVRFDNAIPFDLHFVLSASPSSAADDLDGLLHLGTAIQAVNDTPDLVGGALLGNTVRLSFEAMTTEEMGRIWALFPAVNYRTSVVILATPVWIDPLQSTPAAHPVVSEKYWVEPLYGELQHGA